MLAAHIAGVLERRIGVAAHRRQRDHEIRAGRLEQQTVTLARARAICHRRQRLDVELDRLQRILGGAGAVRHDHGDRLADIAHLVAGDDRLLIGRERRQQLLPHGDDRDLADIGCGDDRMHAGPRQCGARIDRADAPMRDRAAQDDGVQNVFAGDVVDELAAAAQEAQVFKTLDRAAHEGIRRALMIDHMTIVARSLSSARATLMAASAEVFGLERDGLPCN